MAFATKITLPEPDGCGRYWWADGSHVRPAAYADGKWCAETATKVVTNQLGDAIYHLDPESAALALYRLGVGPAAKPAPPKLPDGYDAQLIPPHLEWTGEVRVPKKGEWILAPAGAALRGAYQPCFDWTTGERPILVPKDAPAAPPVKAEPPHRRTYTIEWAFGSPPIKRFEGTVNSGPWNPEPQEKAMEPNDAPKGEPLSKEDREFCLHTLKNTIWGPAHRAAIEALAAECRRLRRKSDPVPPALSAYVGETRRLEPLPGVLSRLMTAAGVAVITALATVAGAAGGMALALRFHLIH